MDRSGGNIELFAGDDEESLQGAMRHGAGGLVHASSQGLGIMVTAADVGEEQERVAVKSPIAAQFVVHGGRQWNDAVLVTFAIADEQLVFAAGDVVNGQAQTFA